MLPKTHKLRTDVVKLIDIINLNIKELRNAKRDVQVLLDQEVILKDDSLLDYVTERLDKVQFINRQITEYDKYKRIEHEHPRKCSSSERHYSRDLSYSLFHRSLSHVCKVIDLDFLEYRKRDDGELSPVLIYDVKQVGRINLQKEASRKRFVPAMTIYKKIADACKIPFWMVGYTQMMDEFEVNVIESIEPFECKTFMYSAEEYKKIIESL